MGAPAALLSGSPSLHCLRDLRGPARLPLPEPQSARPETVRLKQKQTAALAEAHSNSGVYRKQRLPVELPSGTPELNQGRGSRVSEHLVSRWWLRWRKYITGAGFVSLDCYVTFGSPCLYFRLMAQDVSTQLPTPAAMTPSHGGL